MKTWAQINRARRKYINYSTLVLNRMLAGVRKEVARSYIETGTVSVPRATVQKKMQEAWEQIYTTTGTAFAEMEATRLSKLVKQRKDQEGMGHMWRARMLDYVRLKCARKIADSTRVLFDDIERITKRVVAEAAEQGWGAQRVATEIMKKQKEIDLFRAMRIARTEVVGASNIGGYEGAHTLGVKVRTIWLATAHGDRREGHWALNGTSVSDGERFTVVAEDGTTDYMLYPHDPEGSAANVIQCRCGHTFEPETSYIDQLLSE